jgi:hypothetical protein
MWRGRAVADVRQFGPAARRGGRRWLRATARAGYVARAGFYLLLAYLVLEVATLHGQAAQQARRAAQTGQGGTDSAGRQDNAHGALSLVAQTALGKVVLFAAAAGFLLLGGVRLAAAWRDRDAGHLRRLTVAGQGVLSLLVAAIPVSYLRGNRAAGSESQQHASTARLLGLPGGRVVVVAVGAGVLMVCAWQIRGAARQDFADGMRLRQAPRAVGGAVRVSGTVGIIARALLFVPLAVFLILAGIRADPRRARGLDDELLLLAGYWWGKAILVAVALALLTFACYSLLEARYRDVTRGK